MRASRNLKQFKFFYRLIQTLNSLIFLEQAIRYMKQLWSISIHLIDWISWRKVWNFQASYFSSEVFKLTNSFRSLDQFLKQLNFSSQLFELWSWSWSIFFTDWISARRLRFLNKHFQPWRFLHFSKLLHRRN